ncbi:pilus assembly protein TadG-related protein [Granulosicoccus antarcticus]|uniref:Putative Flp pilus-assembly TadG-like N-terminal domain-containing protein n=1 Tax=Granulosicoccus antarcticus IMCC3135 TaxID=1192854 RepID=A0A2Z2NPT5_9GAMM|nr:pilus assembly protein TadG-related protein [Granulosicoccus antarcticus]ASJ71941.1 hypothetical protein IMCC3135_09220 [Granulosicoccus antarcticus IMCC3135]
MNFSDQRLNLRTGPSRRIQRGQVFPLGIALLLFGVLGGFVLYNTAQMATDKTRLANTADAAAYSGLQWQARALNFQAYTNRAMIANQVSIAQGVSLRSWAAYGVIGTENIAKVLSAVPVLNGIASGAEQVMAGVEMILGPIAEGMVMVIDQINKGLSLSQEAMFYGAFMATPAIVDTVVSETDSRFSVLTGYSVFGIAQNLDSWNGFTEGYETDDLDAMQERQYMINASLDDFSKARDWEFFDFWFYSTPITRHKMYRRGSTKLTMVEGDTGFDWEWKAKDTLSLQNRIWRPFRSEKKIEIPIGWAQAFANSLESDSSIEPCVREYSSSDCKRQRYASPNSTAEKLSDRNTPSLGLSDSRIDVSGYSGVQAYRSLSQDTIDEDEPALKLKVEVAMSLDDVKNTTALGVGDTFDTDMVAIGDEASSISIAEVYYERPDTYRRQDLPRENANGYNPYWDVRLSPIADQERLLALSLRAVTGGTVPSASPDNGEGIPEEAEGKSASGTADLKGGESATARKVVGGQGLRLESLAGGGMSLPDFQIPNSIDAGRAVQALIAAYGASALPDDYSQYLSLIQSGDPKAIAEHFAGAAIDDFRNTIQDYLENVLRDAVADMLRGIVTDYVSNVVGTDIEELADSVEDLAQNQLDELIDPELLETIKETAEEARVQMLELREEYERIRVEVVSQFEISMQEVSLEIERELQSLQDQINPLREELRNLNVDDSDGMRRINRQLEPLNERRRELQSDDYLGDELVDELMQIFDEVASDPSAYSRELARYMVKELLREASGELEFPWAEELEEEEENFDDSDETLEEIRATKL